VQRCKSHFHSLACGVDVILGLNGYIWVSAHVPQELDEIDTELVYSNKNKVRWSHKTLLFFFFGCNGQVISPDVPPSQFFARAFDFCRTISRPWIGSRSPVWPTAFVHWRSNSFTSTIPSSRLHMRPHYSISSRR